MPNRDELVIAQLKAIEDQHLAERRRLRREIARKRLGLRPEIAVHLDDDDLDLIDVWLTTGDDELPPEMHLERVQWPEPEPEGDQVWVFALPFLALGRAFERFSDWWWVVGPRFISELFDGLKEGIKALFRQPWFWMAVVFMSLFAAAFLIGFS